MTSFPRRCGSARPQLLPAYTPAMRRWVCIVALLAGFSGQGYAWTIRPRIPAPIERPFEAQAIGRRAGTAGPMQPTDDWWRRP